MSLVGVDPSVRAPAFAIWPTCETWQFETRGQGAERLLHLYEGTHDWALLHAPEDLEAVFIERPRGRFDKQALDQASGVLQVALLKALSTRFPHPASCFEVSPGTWKKAALGNGAAKKQEVLKWAFDQPATKPVLTQDEADALAIACAGSRLIVEGE